MSITRFALSIWSTILIYSVILVSTQDFFGERAGRCPQYPSAHHTDKSCSEKPDCVRDASCPVTKKCCENPCGVSKCINSVLPEVPRLEQEKCPDHGNPEKILSDVMSGNCQPIQTKFCYRDSCRRCCVHISDCNPAETLLMKADECHRVLCKRHPCRQQGSFCEVDTDTNEPQCLCNKDCNDVTKTVCGTDGDTYKNPCLLDLEACLLGIRIQFSHEGKCPVKPTGKPEYSNISINCNPVCKSAQYTDAEQYREQMAREESWTSLLRVSRYCDLQANYRYEDKDSPVPPIVKPDRARIEPGESIAYICKESVTDATIKWYKRRNGKEDVEVPVSLTYFKRVTDSKGKRRRYLFLKITSANRGNSGQYVCKQTYEKKVTEASVRLILSWIGKEKIGCNKPPDKGPCHGVFNNYFYDSKDGLCKPFIYGGCKGNENNFENRRDCTLLCKGLKARIGCPQSVEAPDFCTSRQDRCSLDKDCPTDHNCCYVGCYKDCYKPIPINKNHLLQPEEEPCGQRTCKYYSKCQLTIDGNSKECSCPSVCSFENLKAVCGSDEKTYPSECFLRVNACRWQRTVSVSHEGPCRTPSMSAPVSKPTDLCTVMKCPPYSTCVFNPIDKQPTCICPKFCDFVYEPVCGSNGRTYLNECIMRVESCARNLFISKERNGQCRNGFGAVE